MSNVKDIQAKVDNASRHVGTSAKKVRARIKTEIPSLLQMLIDEVYSKKSELSTYQKMGLAKDLIKMGVDAEKIIDGHSAARKGSKPGIKDKSEEDSYPEGNKVLPYIRTSM